MTKVTGDLKVRCLIFSRKKTYFDGLATRNFSQQIVKIGWQKTFWENFDLPESLDGPSFVLSLGIFSGELIVVLVVVVANRFELRCEPKRLMLFHYQICPSLMLQFQT